MSSVGAICTLTITLFVLYFVPQCEPLESINKNIAKRDHKNDQVIFYFKTQAPAATTKAVIQHKQSLKAPNKTQKKKKLKKEVKKATTQKKKKLKKEAKKATTQKKNKHADTTVEATDETDDATDATDAVTVKSAATTTTETTEIADPVTPYYRPVFDDGYYIVQPVRAKVIRVRNNRNRFFFGQRQAYNPVASAANSISNRRSYVVRCCGGQSCWNVGSVNRVTSTVTVKTTAAEATTAATDSGSDSTDMDSSDSTDEAGKGNSTAAGNTTTTVATTTIIK